MRQIDALEELGVSSDVMFVRGFQTPRAYAVAAGKLAQLAMTRRPRYGLVHCHGGEVAPLTVAFVHTPIVASYLGSDLQGHRDASGFVSGPHRLRARLVGEGSRVADRTITVSARLSERLPHSGRQRNTVIPDGVDTRVFTPVPRLAARRELGWDPDGSVVLFAASATAPVKRFWLAEAACRVASGRVPGLELRVIEDAEPGAMPTIMSAADCLLMTSSSEGSSNVVKEALACNLPVVATDAGDMAALLAGVMPSYVCAAQPERLADAIVACLRGGARSNGRARAVEFDALAVAARIIAVYTEARR
jgi:glycosyltransferase involved in cell wall biosynthesis